MYFIELGIHPALSKAELLAVYGEQITIKKDLENLLFFDFNHSPINLSDIQDRLAGIIKIGQIINEIDLNSSDLKERLADLMYQDIKKNELKGKIKFGLSLYSVNHSKLIAERQKIGLTLKKKLKNDGYSVRYVDSKEPILSSVIVKTNKLIESGAEFVHIVVDNKVLLGRTQAVQDFKAWSNRDFGRPARDSLSGMLPPKLARMMINLSGTKPEDTLLLDPFCGSGTVLMEASLMGFNQLIGSDISEKAIRDTKTNLNWLKNLYPDLKNNFILQTTPAESIDQYLNSDVNLIVTETSLGPPLKGRETRIEIENNIKKLMSIYIPSFTTLYSVLERGGRAIIAWPAFRFKNELIHVPVKEMFEEIGFRLIRPDVELTEAGGLLYERKGQKVAREIFILEK